MRAIALACALLLRMLGHVPGNFDMLFYDGARS